MKVETLIETQEGYRDGSKTKFKKHPPGRILDDPDSWILCTTGQAKPLDQEAEEKVAEHRIKAERYRKATGKKTVDDVGDLDNPISNENSENERFEDSAEGLRATLSEAGTTTEEDGEQISSSGDAESNQGSADGSEDASSSRSGIVEKED